MNKNIIIIIVVVIVLILLIYFSKKCNKFDSDQIIPIQNNYIINGNFPISNVDLIKYVGLWYEIAKLPNEFEQGCTDAYAIYNLNKNGGLSISNTCTYNDMLYNVSGEAQPNYPAIDRNVYPGSFTVDFGNTTGQYNIIYLDPDYKYAMIGTYDRKYLWIISRTRYLEIHILKILVDAAKNLGFDTDKLIYSYNEFSE